MSKRTEDSEQIELIRTLVIAQLALAGVPGHDIRKIVKCGLARVTQVIKHLPRRNTKK